MKMRAISVGAAAALAGALATDALASGIVAQTYVHPEGTSGTALGAAVANIGPRVVLGAPDASSPGCPFYGAVHVYDGDTGVSLLEIVDESAEACFGRLGWAVAEIDGDILASAPFHTESGAATSSGAVFRFDATTGALKQTFLHPAPSDRDPDVFGAALAVAGGDVWIGSPEGAEVTVGGEVLPSGIVFHFDAATGDLLGSLTSPTPAPNDSFGWALASSNGRLFVGAPGAVDSPGAVHAFDLATGQHLWTATDAEVGSFGRAVAANDTIVAVGDPFRSFGDGSIHLLGASDGALVRRLESPDPNPSFAGNNFGFSVARFGGGFLVGAPQTEVGGFLPGIAYLFDAPTGALAYRFNLLDFRSELGTAVAAFGDRVLVGAPGFDNAAALSGGAVLFETCASLGDGAACDDGNGCDTGDVCSGAVCVPGTPVTCPTPPQCNSVGCEPATGRCNESPLPNGSLCFLGGPTTCSVGDRCSSGRCFRNFDLPPPEQRDSDFDGICVSDDDCPTVVDPGQEDADSDLAGDACDPNDGLLLVHSAVLRANRAGRPATGRLTLRGELLSRGGEVGFIPFNPDGGISVRIEDAASFAQGFAWAAGQCTGSGRLRCIRSGRPTARIDFRPLQQRTDGVIVYTFSMKLDGVDVETPLVPPLQARLTSQPATPVIGFDRVGAVGGCREGRRRFSCRVAVPGSASEAFLDLPASLVD